MKNTQSNSVKPAKNKDANWSVYIHTNRTNNKSYIGITHKLPDKRWGKNGERYLDKYKNGSYKHPLFARALKKYSDWDNDWEHIVFADNLSEREAKHMEKLLIALYQTNVCRYGSDYGYNCTDGGDGAVGYRHTEESKKKMSQVQKGKRISEAQIALIIEMQSIPIVQLDLNNNYINEYKSASVASSILNIDERSIRKCIYGEFFTAGGFKWIDLVDYQNGLLPPDLPRGQRYQHGVRQYNRNGKLVGVYQNMIEAECATGVSSRLIGRVCLGKAKSAGGYLWISQQDFDNGIRIDTSKTTHRNNIAILQISLDGYVLAEYKSITAAHIDTGISAGSICQSCKHDKKTAGGFKWMYKEEYDPSKTYHWANGLKRKIVQLTLDNQFIAKYDSIAMASVATGIIESGIGHCCTGKHSSSGGFKWMYLEDYKNLTKQND